MKRYFTKCEPIVSQCAVTVQLQNVDLEHRPAVTAVLQCPHSTASQLQAFRPRLKLQQQINFIKIFHQLK